MIDISKHQTLDHCHVPVSSNLTPLTSKITALCAKMVKTLWKCPQICASLRGYVGMVAI